MKYCNKSRRMFLQGAGGTFLSIPVLSSILGREARAQAVVHPKYIQLVTSESGHKASNDPSFYPTMSIGDDAKAGALADVIARNGKISANFGTAFNPFAGKINIISNSTCYAKNLFHNECVPTTGGGVLSAGRTDAANKFSVDYRLEQNIYRNRPAPALKALRVNLDYISSEGSAQYKSCYSLNGVGVTPGTITSLAGIKSSPGLLMGSNTGQSGSTGANLARRNLFNSVFADYQKLMGDKRISADDKKILEAAMDNVSKIQQGESTAGQMGCSMPANGSEVNYWERHKRAIDMIVAALSCGLTEIVAYTIYQGEDTVFSRPAIHGRHHARGDDKINEYMRWRAKVVAYFVQRLAGTPSPSGGSLLDDSLVYFGQEFGDVDTRHRFDGCTSFIAGSAGGRIKTGLHIDAGQAPLGRVLITIMKAFGLATEQIEAGAAPGFGEYSTFYQSGTRRLGDYDPKATAKFFQLAEKRKGLPILIP